METKSWEELARSWRSLYQQALEGWHRQEQLTDKMVNDALADCRKELEEAHAKIERLEAELDDSRIYAATGR